MRRRVVVLVADIDGTLRPWPSTRADLQRHFPGARALFRRVRHDVPLVFLTAGQTSLASANARFVRRLLRQCSSSRHRRRVLLLSRTAREAATPGATARVHSGRFKADVLREVRAALRVLGHGPPRLVCLGDDASGDAAAYRSACCDRGGYIRRVGRSVDRFYTQGLTRRVLAAVNAAGTHSSRGVLTALHRRLRTHGAARRYVDARFVVV